MLQLVYISSVVGVPSVREIVNVSRRNNLENEVTGFLYSDGVRFLQALEGPSEAVDATYARIEIDTRHRALVLLSRRDIEAREFGSWAMAVRSPKDDVEQLATQISPLLENASGSVRATFESFMRLERLAR